MLGAADLKSAGKKGRKNKAVGLDASSPGQKYLLKDGSILESTRKGFSNKTTQQPRHLSPSTDMGKGKKKEINAFTIPLQSHSSYSPHPS